MAEEKGHEKSVGKTIYDVIFEITEWLRKFLKSHPVIGVVIVAASAFGILLLFLWQLPSIQRRADEVASGFLDAPAKNIPESKASAKKPGKEKVIFLLPSGKGVPDSIKQDAEHQVLGFFDYLSAHEPEDEFSLEVVVRSHGMESARAEDIVREEMSNGNRYFVVTMSKIAEPLARKWQEIVNQSCQSKECFLIATVASAPGLANNSSGVYRFYVRSDEEAEELARLASASTKKNAVTICVDDTYGRGATERFRLSWERTGGRVTKSIFLSPGASEEKIDRHFQDLVELSVSEREIVFVANYGSGISSTIKELHERNSFPLLLMTSTFSIREWRSPVRSQLEAFDWLSLQPVYRGEGNQDVVRNFTFFTLMRLQESIFLTKQTNCSFEIAWQRAQFPADLSFVLDNRGDSKITLRRFGPEDAKSQEAETD